MSDRRRLGRLRRLETVRAIARQTAAAQSAEAESTLAQLQALAERTRSLAADYAARSAAHDGDTLRRLAEFRSGLAGVAEATQADVTRAQALADVRMQELAAAERRRQAASERAEAVLTALGRAAHAAPLSGRRTLGTELD